MKKILISLILIIGLSSVSYSKNFNDDFTNLIAVSKVVDVYKNNPKIKQRIMDAVFKYSEKYNIDPVTLTCLLANESSLNPQTTHSSVYVKVPLKRGWTKVGTKKVRAVGLGGIIYEIWRYELKDAGIKSRKSLYTVENNIKASALILSIYQHERKQIRGTSSTEESSLLRYYGVIRKNKKLNKTYSIKIYKIKKTQAGIQGT